MPPNHFYEGNESVLRFKLWNQINKIIDDQKRYDATHGFGNNQDLDIEDKPGDYIADITFAKSDTGENNLLYRIIKLTK